MSLSICPFIEQGADGVAYIEGTRTKVIEVALDQMAYIGTPLRFIANTRISRSLRFTRRSASTTRIAASAIG